MSPGVHGISKYVVAGICEEEVLTEMALKLCEPGNSSDN